MPNPFRCPPLESSSLGFDPSPSEAAMLGEIRNRESSDNYKATNPNSTASGAYQFINSTWRMASDATGAPRYATAAQAPQSVQDQNALYMLRQFGPNAKITWAESGPYTKVAAVPQKDPLTRMLAGEDVELTPEVINQIVTGPLPGSQPAAPTPTPAPAPAPPQPKMVKFEPYQPPPPEPTFGQGVLSGLANFPRQVGAG